MERGGEVEPRVQHVANRREEAVHVPDERGGSERDGEEVRVAVESDDAEWVQPLPHGARLLGAGEVGEFGGAAVVDRLREEEEDEGGGGAGEGGLEPEDVAPAAVGDDYAADEGAWVG